MWFENIIQAKHAIPFGLVLVACKCDTPEEEWAVTREEIMDFVNEHDVALVETSAKDPDRGDDIDKVFSTLVARTAVALAP